MNDTKSLLATHVRRLSGPQFEEFCCELLLVCEGREFLGGKLLSAQPFGRPGQNQDGIDIICNVERDSQKVRLVVQCKRVQDWDVQKTKAAVSKVTHPADECILMLGSETDVKVQRVVAEAKSQEGIPFWYVWFIDSIQRHIEVHLKNDVGARLLTKFFGVAVSLELIGLQQASPLMTAYGKMAGNVGPFLHEHPLLGRTKELQSLTAFLENDEKRVLLLSAAGGQGKTRLLFEFAQVAAKERTRCVRWLDECSPPELDEALQWLPKADQILLILDDVHRWETAPSSFYEKLRRLGTRLKVVIGTRPYRLKETEKALSDAGYLASQQTTLPPLRPLGKPVQKQMAQQALTEGLKHWSEPLVGVAGNSPLIILLGAYYLNQRNGQVNLHQDEAFRRDVLQGLVDEGKIAKSVEGLSSREIAETLDMLAILSSAPADEALREKMAKFVGLSIQQMQRLFEELRNSGHLETRQDGNDLISYRLVPDLMADYRACDACFDQDGKPKEMPLRLWNHLGSDKLLPAMLRNLSEAEFVTKLIYPRSGKVTKPLMDALKADYQKAGWRRRTELLGIWQSVAEFQPFEALQQVRQALNLKDDQPVETPSVIEEWFPTTPPPSYTDIVRLCADIVEIIGSRYEDHTANCLDLLWDMDAGRHDELLQKIGNICSIASPEKQAVAERGLAWIKAQISQPEHLPCQERLGGVIHPMLDWCFNLQNHENVWTDEKTIEFRVRSRPLPPTRHFREEALSICLLWIGSSVPDARIAAANFFRHFIVPDNMAVKHAHGGTAEDRKAWKKEQANALKELGAVVREISDATTLWAIRHMLIEALPYALHENTGHHLVHDLLDIYPDTFELRVHRLLLSSEHSDIPEPEEWCRNMAKQQSSPSNLSPYDYASVKEKSNRQRQTRRFFVESIAKEVLEKTRDLSGLRHFLSDWMDKLALLGPARFGEFLSAVMTQQPTLLFELGESIFAGENEALDNLLWIILDLIRDQKHLFSTWILRALNTPRSSIVIQGIRCLPIRDVIGGEALEALCKHARHPEAKVRGAILSWAKDALICYEDPSKVLAILASFHIAPDESLLWGQWVECLRGWLGHIYHEQAIPHGSQLLNLLLPVPNLSDHRMLELVVIWSRHEPAQCLEFLEARMAEWQRRHETGDTNYRPLPHAVDLGSMEQQPGMDQKLATAFQQLTTIDSEVDGVADVVFQSWFTTLAWASWNSYRQWLIEGLAQLHGEDFLSALKPIESGTQLPFHFPDLTERLLIHAKKEPVEIRDRLRLLLMSSLRPNHGFDYIPGSPRAHDLANREKALELAKVYRSRPTLQEFYTSILRSSERSIEAAKEEIWE